MVVETGEGIKRSRGRGAVHCVHLVHCVHFVHPQINPEKPLNHTVSISYTKNGGYCKTSFIAVLAMGPCKRPPPGICALPVFLPARTQAAALNEHTGMMFSLLLVAGAEPPWAYERRYAMLTREELRT